MICLPSYNVNPVGAGIWGALFAPLSHSYNNYIVGVQ